MKCRAFFVILFCFATLTPAFGNNDSPLEKAETLITELKFYDALIALEPLLTTGQKSADQEEALWLANTLCNQLRKSLSDEFWEIELDSLWRKFRDELKAYPNPQRSGVALKWEKAAALNRLGADIVYDEIGGIYWYHYGFLKRLVALYPNSSWRPAAEYYLIQEGYPTPQDINKTLNTLHSYVEKYTKSGLAEVYMAYLDIAHLYHGLWAVLAHPDDPYSRHFDTNSDDPEKDKQRAAKYKAEALKHYAKFIVRYGNIVGYESKDAIESFEELKQNKNSGYGWIFYD